MISHPFVDAFLAYKEIECGLLPNSIKSYLCTFSIFSAFPQFVRFDNPATMTEPQFRALLYCAFKERSWSSRTFNRIRVNLLVFCNWLVSNGILTENPMRNISRRKLESVLPKMYPPEDIQRIICGADNLWSCSVVSHFCRRAIVRTFVYTGIRMAELQNLDVSDLHLSSGNLLIRRGKGARDRFVPIPDALAGILGQYLSIRSRVFPDSNVLFVNENGERLNANTLDRWFKALSRAVGFKVGKHRLRHSFATELCRQNVNLYTVQNILGHASPETTKVYLRFNVIAAKDVIDSVPLYT